MLARTFPLTKPTWPNGVQRPPVERTTGIHYDTTWARRYPARLARALIVDDVLRPVVHLLGSPRVHGLDHIEHLDAPVIFAPNHHSHLDTPLVLACLPTRFRHRTVVAAAADYFFTTKAKGALSSITIGAIPIERQRLNRRSADLAAGLLEDGWNLVIFPEGGRTPDGWAQEFRGGAAYLAERCRRPIVPVHVEGTRRVMRKGAKYPTPVGTLGRGPGVQVTFGRPLVIEPGENARRLGVRLEAAVATLADERDTDWWTARKRAAAGGTPSLRGPDSGAWRRAWALPGGRRRSSSSGPDWP
ncbi:MAG: lysophospholipid acyltransferase family protein [Acidimicrobiales bacterium]